MPNAEARGYYRWALPSDQLRALLDRGWARLSPLERTSVASNLRAAFSSATLPASEVVAVLPRIAEDPTRAVATEPMGLASVILDSMVTGSGPIATPLIDYMVRRKASMTTTMAIFEVFYPKRPVTEPRSLELMAPEVREAYLRERAFIDSSRNWPFSVGGLQPGAVFSWTKASRWKSYSTLATREQKVL